MELGKFLLNQGPFRELAKASNETGQSQALTSNLKWTFESLFDSNDDHGVVVILPITYSSQLLYPRIWWNHSA